MKECCFAHTMGTCKARNLARSRPDPNCENGLGTKGMETVESQLC